MIESLRLRLRVCFASRVRVKVSAYVPDLATDRLTVLTPRPLPAMALLFRPSPPPQLWQEYRTMKRRAPQRHPRRLALGIVRPRERRVMPQMRRSVCVPAFQQKLTQQQLDDLMVYLHTL